MEKKFANGARGEYQSSLSGTQTINRMSPGLSKPEMVQLQRNFKKKNDTFTLDSFNRSLIPGYLETYI